MKFHTLFVLNLFCSSAIALKGHRENRGLRQVGNVRLLEDAEKGSDKTTEPKDEKVEKGKKDTNKDKKGKKDKVVKGKKCKNNPTDEPTEDLSEDLDRYLEVDVDTDEDDYEGEICKPFKKSANCEELLGGVYPSVPEEAGDVGGTVTLEMHPKVEVEEAVKKMGDVLEEVALATAGCEPSRRKLEASNATNVTEVAEVGLSGMSLGSLGPVSDICENIENENCTQFGSSLTVYFSGNASNDDISSMMTQFASAILEGANNGEYDDFAEVYWVGTTSEGVKQGAFTSSASSTRGESGGANVGAIVGGVIGGLAVVGAVVGGFLFYKKRQGAAAVGPSEGGETEGFAFPKFFRRGED